MEDMQKRLERLATPKSVMHSTTFDAIPLVAMRRFG